MQFLQVFLFVYISMTSLKGGAPQNNRKEINRKRRRMALKLKDKQRQQQQDKLRKFKEVYKKDVSYNLTYQPHLLYPLVISNCNGTGSWSFSDATIEYEESGLALPVYAWFRDVFKDIAHELQGKAVFNREKEYAMECLLDSFLSTDRHMNCLKSLITDKKKSEAKVKTILAIHYFQPLVYGSRYVIDRGSLVTCELCKEKIEYGDTSFGNICVWHGMADIVIQKTVIKVSTKSSNDEDADDLAGGESPAKQRKADRTAEDDSLIIEFEKTKNKKSKSQALAQGIVNAFCEANRDKSVFNKYVPSFLTTEETIRIILYNCEADILLISDEFPIWKEGEATLDTNTLVHVWLFLNFQEFELHAHDFILNYTCIPPSKFKEVVGNVYQIYKENVTRPLKTTDHTTKMPKKIVSLDSASYKKYTDLQLDMFHEVEKL